MQHSIKEISSNVQVSLGKLMVILPIKKIPVLTELTVHHCGHIKLNLYNLFPHEPF
jgi:hypothetical protein